MSNFARVTGTPPVAHHPPGVPPITREQTALDRLALRTLTEQSFLGGQLHRYATRHGLDDAALAVELGVELETLAHLRLCGRLRVETPGVFAADVRGVAGKFGCDAVVLAKMVLE